MPTETKEVNLSNDLKLCLFFIFSCLKRKFQYPGQDAIHLSINSTQDSKLFSTTDKLFHSFSLPYVLKLTASQTKTFVLLVNQEGHNNLHK